MGFHISNGVCGHEGEKARGSETNAVCGQMGSWGFHISNVEDGGSINQMPVSIERQTSLVLAVAAPLSSDPALFTPDLDGGCENCDGCCSCCCCCL